MPNGVDKNWVRLCLAIDGFRARYNSWPNYILLSKEYFENIQSLFSPKVFQKLKSQITFVIDEESLIVAKDNTNRMYNYRKEGSSKIKPDISAQEWLKVQPDLF